MFEPSDLQNAIFLLKKSFPNFNFELNSDVSQKNPEIKLLSILSPEHMRTSIQYMTRRDLTMKIYEVIIEHHELLSKLKGIPFRTNDYMNNMEFRGMNCGLVYTCDGNLYFYYDWKQNTKIAHDFVKNTKIPNTDVLERILQFFPNKHCALVDLVKCFYGDDIYVYLDSQHNIILDGYEFANMDSLSTYMERRKKKVKPRIQYVVYFDGKKIHNNFKNIEDKEIPKNCVGIITNKKKKAQTYEKGLIDAQRIMLNLLVDK